MGRQAGRSLESARGLAGIQRKQQGEEKQQSHDLLFYTNLRAPAAGASVAPTYGVEAAFGSELFGPEQFQGARVATVLRATLKSLQVMDKSDLTRFSVYKLIHRPEDA